MTVPIGLQWQGEPPLYHKQVIETAHRSYDVLKQALSRIYPTEQAEPHLKAALCSPLAVGGGMAVYKITVTLSKQPTRHLICKIPHQRRIVYAPGTTHQDATETTRELLDRLAHLAQHLDQCAPGLFPRSGGVWHWRDAQETAHHLLMEEFIPGLSVQRLKHDYERQLLDGQCNTATYQKRCIAIERLAIALYTRLWDCLERRMFTSDPSPWNILVRPAQDTPPPSPATIIDLHGLEDNTDLSYVIQRLAAVYGMRQEVLEEVLLPGILDTLGSTTGKTLLAETLPTLQVQARQLRQNLGVDMLQPLLQAIQRLL
jgi:hypothetical protein